MNVLELFEEKIFIEFKIKIINIKKDNLILLFISHIYLMLKAQIGLMVQQNLDN